MHAAPVFSGVYSGKWLGRRADTQQGGVGRIW